MAYEVKRSDEEIDAVLNIAFEHEDEGKQSYPGMSFEQGVSQGIQWVLGQGDDEAPPAMTRRAAQLLRLLFAGLAALVLVVALSAASCGGSHNGSNGGGNCDPVCGCGEVYVNGNCE